MKNITNYKELIMKDKNVTIDELMIIGGKNLIKLEADIEHLYDDIYECFTEKTQHFVGTNDEILLLLGCNDYLTKKEFNYILNVSWCTEEKNGKITDFIINYIRGFLVSKGEDIEKINCLTDYALTDLYCDYEDTFVSRYNCIQRLNKVMNINYVIK